MSIGSKMLAKLLAAAFTLTAFGAARADSAQPIKAQSIALGEVFGVAYYTVESEGFRVVTTLAQGETGAPVRMVAVLAPGQSVTLSSLREQGVAPIAIEISRQADTLRFRKAEAVTD